MRIRILVLLFPLSVSAVVKYDPAGRPVDPKRCDKRLDRLLVYNQNPIFNVLVPCYDNPARTREIACAIQKNSAHKLIKKIYVFYETKTPVIPEFLKDPKIEVIFTDHVPLHKDFYDFANTKLAGELVIMSNSDIFFDETIELLKYVNFSEYTVALSRYRYEDRGLFTLENGQDCWIFKSPMNYVSGDYKFGRYNTEYGFIRESMANGRAVINPCLTITTWHVHADSRRKWAHYIDPQMATMSPCLVPFLTLTEALSREKKGKTCITEENRKINTSHGASVKLKVALGAIGGRTPLPELCEEFDVVPSQIYAWVKHIEDYGTKLFEKTG